MSIPTHISVDRTLRVKILDACGMTCTFCHNVGTPVAADNHRRLLPLFTSSGVSGRTSIYAETNGVEFLPAKLSPNAEFGTTLEKLRDRLGFTELHLTGGEPTLHPDLSGIVRVGRAAGFNVRMTSNGENGLLAIPKAAMHGLEKINFSIFGTTPEELAQVQHGRFTNRLRAQRKITALQDAVDVCAQLRVKADANIVVVDESHIERVHRLLDEWSPHLSVRLLNSLDHGQASLDAIEEVLRQRGAEPTAHYLTAGASGARTAYRLREGRVIYVKIIRPTRLPRTCSSCRFNNGTDCQEGFYGVRLYLAQDGRWMVGVCIQRMDLCQELNDFLAGDLPDEILRLREDEETTLREQNQ